MFNLVTKKYTHAKLKRQIYTNETMRPTISARTPSFKAKKLSVLIV